MTRSLIHLFSLKQLLYETVCGVCDGVQWDLKILSVSANRKGDEEVTTTGLLAQDPKDKTLNGSSLRDL